MEPTLSQLSYFAAVAEAGSFTAAARALSVGQPTVSAAIAELEAVVGTRLFQRSRTGVALTLAGRALSRLTGAFVAEQPGVDVVFKECAVGELDARVETQHADVVVAPRGIGSPGWIRCTLYRERLR